jgi:serine protease Do
MITSTMGSFRDLGDHNSSPTGRKGTSCYFMLKVGQFAIAIGNPLGLGTTITFGMVSAIDRTIRTRETFLEGLIQTSAQINPGNSGGALVNTNAKLIGIPTAMVPWSQGIGFAIVIDGVKSVFDELLETGTIRTPWMGVVQIPKGPAAEAGLKAGDVIIAIDEKKVETMEELRGRIIHKSVGDQIKLKFHRGRDLLEVVLTLQEAPS